MNSAMLFGRLALQTSCRLNPGGAGQNPLTAADVAGGMAFAGLSQREELIARAKYAGDAAAAWELVGVVAGVFRLRCQLRGWKSGRAHGVAKLAVFELLSDGCCATCGGSGQRQPGRACKSCRGTGRKPLSLRDRAAIAGISKTRFAADWEQRGAELLRDLHDWEQSALRKLGRSMAQNDFTVCA